MLVLLTILRTTPYIGVANQINLFMHSKVFVIVIVIVIVEVYGALDAFNK